MQINVVFGSKSDSVVYEDLCNKLKDIRGLKVNLEICSAHREPERLRMFVQGTSCDLYIAGAGLAAHLPGVIASHTRTPVIGLPCTDVLEGLDALLSTMQMPRGVPVLTAGVGNVESVVRFVKWYSANREQPPIFRLHYPSWADGMAKQLRAPLEKIGWDFVEHSLDVDHPPGVFSLVLADLFTGPPSPSSKEGEAALLPGSKLGIWLGLPIFAQPRYQGEMRLLSRMTDAGGLWVGINNVTNLQLSLLQLWQTGPKEQSLLKELREGEKQSVS